MLLRQYDCTCADQRLLTALSTAGCADVAAILATNPQASHVRCCCPDPLVNSLTCCALFCCMSCCVTMCDNAIPCADSTVQLVHCVTRLLQHMHSSLSGSMLALQVSAHSRAAAKAAAGDWQEVTSMVQTQHRASIYFPQCVPAQMGCTPAVATQLHQSLLTCPGSLIQQRQKHPALVPMTNNLCLGPEGAVPLPRPMCPHDSPCTCTCSSELTTSSMQTMASRDSSSSHAGTPGEGCCGAGPDGCSARSVAGSRPLGRAATAVRTPG